MGGGLALDSILENIEQRKLKAKNEAESKEIKSRAVVYIPETQVTQLEETLRKIENMKVCKLINVFEIIKFSSSAGL